MTIKGDIDMNRTPSKDIQKVLRKENGFKCCFPSCESPYLEYHHFDPPWHIEEHHNPDGMIALCPNHHRKADAGVISKEQLLDMKKIAKKEFENIKGDFEWLRRKILLVAGGNFYFDNKVDISLMNKPLIWFNIDEEGYRLLNMKLHDKHGNLKLHIEDNVWIIKTGVKDIECPPSGKDLKIYFENGDNIRLKFLEINSVEEFEKRYPDVVLNELDSEYPFSALTVAMKLSAFNINFQERKTIFNRNGTIIKDCLFKNNNKGLVL